ncbi:hypothetical protein BROUX41_005208 [Berkeleyomyces rouxiae]|uniref:uncharacterized protein n=1 Tax=Berkeleyomyces rouxiae TaxID=2035830 RepID=UPI003B7B7ACA
MSFDYSAPDENVNPLLNVGLSAATATYDPQSQRYTITTAAGTSILLQTASAEFPVLPTAGLIAHPHPQAHAQQHLQNSPPHTQSQHPQPQPQQHQTPHPHSQVQLGLHSPIHMMPPQGAWAMGLDMTSVSASNSPQSQPVLDEQQLQHQQQHQQVHHHQHQQQQQFHQSQPNSQCSSPHSQNSSQHSPLAFSASLSPLPDWAIQQQQSPPMGHQQQHSPPMQPLQHSQMPMPMGPVDAQAINDQAMLGFSTFPSSFNQAAIGLLPAATQNALANTMAMEAFNMPAMDDSGQWSGLGYESWTEIAASPLEMSPIPRGMHSVGSGSPNSGYIDVVSLPGSVSGMSENWNMVEWNAGMMAGHPTPAIFNPGQTLHLRTHSDADSISQVFNGIDDFPFPFSPSGSESHDASSPISQRNCYHDEGHHMSHGHDHAHSHGHNHSHSQEISSAAITTPINIKSSQSTRSGSSSKSPGNGSGVVTSSPVSTVARRNTGPKKSPISKPKVVRRTSTGKKDGPSEKKVGRRRGPLLPEQRKQASEIRKLRACLRCKFLKKTCDKGEPCAGCQPSHARLWQVPCTRIDIKDIGYFMKDWNADYARHISPDIPVLDVKGYSKNETLIWITHGYGCSLPVMAREVLLADEKFLEVDWVETDVLNSNNQTTHNIRTDRLDIGASGIPPHMVSDYLDKHVDELFQDFVDDYFGGTPFITEILKTAHRYYKKEQSPVIRKALKLVMAYNLTMHITMIEDPSSELDLEATIDDKDSKFHGRTVAPSLINAQIKSAMADMWRELQRDVLEELSQLYSSVYSGERLKNWPTIFMLASILLAVWEEMQFDCHYRVPDPASVNKFCSDMETTPVGVIVGLFHAISQKLPAFTDWDTRKHGHILNNNPAVCEALTEVRQHVLKHESYLRGRPDAKFDSTDFDSLSNKFLSKLVIKAN